MKYRPEIDGLRALAVMPVILFHSGFPIFSGGYVGVDIFFVISGYLITTIVLSELEQGTFSITQFYERRARRILPALFLVMSLCLTFGFFLMMPDEYKNLGQSLVATSVFSNNILLGLTTGYWDLASEFKPLLHTWSLGVEEQYYVAFPILLMLLWKFMKPGVPHLLWLASIASFLFLIWLAEVSPTWAFYGLPTRAWEIGIGSIAAYYIRQNPTVGSSPRLSEIASFVGLVFIGLSVLYFDKFTSLSGYSTLLPCLGAVLIIIYCRPNTSVYLILSNRIAVFLGLLSYSLYLWHQPVFAFLRVISKEQPSKLAFLLLFPLIFALSIATWRFVETPFRNNLAINRKHVALYSITLTLFFVCTGTYLNSSYGVSSRVFDSTIAVADVDKRFYNERIFRFKVATFSNDSRSKVLVVGNSFARDFMNIALENFKFTNVELVYRDDLSQCISQGLNSTPGTLFFEADVIVFASGDFDTFCYYEDISFAIKNGKEIYYVGTKHFGFNLNWLIQLDAEDRRNQFNSIPTEILAHEDRMSRIIPAKHYISLIAPTAVNNKMPITDHLGRPLSTDRLHLTKFGAIYLGQHAINGTSFSDVFR